MGIKLVLKMSTMNLILIDALTFAARLIKPWLNGGVVS